jgi:putative transposase
MLTIQKRYQVVSGDRYEYDDTVAIMTEMRNGGKYPWLNDVSKTSLLIILNDLDEAFRNYDKGIVEGPPKFKFKKKYKKSFPVRYDRTYINGDCVHIEKIGMVKFKANRRLSNLEHCKFINPRITLTKHHKWILSFTLECDKQASREPLIGNMGIDMGIRRLATVSYLTQTSYIPNINKSAKVKRLRHKLRYLHRKVGRLYRKHGNYIKSKHIERIEDQIRAIYHHLSNIVKDYNDKQTRYLVNLNPHQVIMENFEVKELLKKMWRPMRREILYAAWYDFRDKMERKCAERGIIFTRAYRSFPSTQMCFECGDIKTGKDKLTTRDHVFVCNKCGYKADRDVNAARNLEWYGDSI